MNVNNINRIDKIYFIDYLKVLLYMNIFILRYYYEHYGMNKINIVKKINHIDNNIISIIINDTHSHSSAGDFIKFDFYYNIS